jgi:hypothetical protein
MDQSSGADQTGALDEHSVPQVPGLPSYRELYQAATEIETLIEQYDPLDLIANFAFENLSYSTGANQPDDGGQAFVEYLAVLCLKKRHLKGTDRCIPPGIIAALQEKVRRLFGFLALRRGLKRQPSSAIDRARRYAELMFLSVRNLDDFDHLEAMLLSLFDDKNESARRFDVHLGFHAAAAPRLATAIGDLLNKQLALRKAAGQECMRRLRREMLKPRGEVPKDLKRFLRQAKTAKQRKQVLLGYIARQTFASLSDVYSFQPGDLTEQLSLDRDGVRALLDAFSMEFGDVSADFVLPTASHDFLFRPIIKSERGYFCPIPDLLLWAIRPRLEECLKTDAAIWDSYQKRRAQLLVERGAALFEKMLPTATVLTGLKYWSAQFSQDRTVREYELDLAILFDGILFLVECKGGTIPAKARSGKRRPTRDALEDLVIEPSSQLDRARKYIDASPNAAFQLSSGVSVVIDRSSFDQRFLVALTLEDLNLLVADPKNLGVLEGYPEERLPWIVNLLTLESISQFIQIPAEFIHYLGRRLQLNISKKVTAIEELDYFGCYLDTGLHFDDAQIGEFSDIALDGFTEPIEAYRRFETGRSTIAVEKPGQKLPPEMLAILRNLERINSRSALQLSLLLLDMNGIARGQVADAISNLRLKAQADGKIHDFSTLRKDGHTGFTFMVAGHLSPRQLLDLLTTWCQIKIEKTGAKCWGGIANTVGSNGMVHECIFIKV